MMHGKFVRKFLPLLVSASLFMGTTASVMAEGTESDLPTEKTMIEQEEPVEEETPLELVEEETDENAEEQIPAEEPITDPVIENEESNIIEEPEGPNSYKVRLKDAYAHVNVRVSDNKTVLPADTEPVTDTDAVTEALNDENLILVTVDNENSDRLLTDKDVENLMDSSADGEDSLITANNGNTVLEFQEGTVVYISAVTDEDYAVSNIFIASDAGESITVGSEEEEGIYSFIMPSSDVDVDVLTQETVEVNPTDLSEEEIKALEEYIEAQGISVTRGAMLLAASSSSVKTVTFNMNGFISYSAEGYGSGYDAMFYISTANYKGNGNGFCLNPAVQAPGSSNQGTSISYTTTVYEYTDPMLLKIMYYGMGGPEDISGSYATTPTAKHILTHMVAVKRAKELGISGAGDYTYRANSTAIAKADALYNAIKAKPDITGTVCILTPVAGQQTIMYMSSYAPPETKGKLTFNKVSGKLELSNGNPNYSLEGAKYRVFADAALTDNKGSFTTDANGNCSTVLSLNPGTYYVKEVIAPKGYLIDETVYTVTIKVGVTSHVTATDMPANDPITTLLQKVDAKTGEATERLKGAKFEVKFYPVENEEDMDEPQWSWVMETDEKGIIRLDDAHKVSGDAFIKDAATGATLIPLGFLTIQETEAPEGYLINDTLYVCQILKDNETVRTTNLPTGENALKEQPEEPKTTEIAVSKTVTGSAGNKNDEFSFMLQLSNNNDPSITIYEGLWYFLEEEGAETVVESVIADSKGNYYFTLHHGQTATFKDIPVGAGYTVSEVDGVSKGYTVTNGKVSGVTTEETVTINVINNKEMTIPTGADTNRNIMLLMASACLILLVFFGGRRFLSRK